MSGFIDHFRGTELTTLIVEYRKEDAFTFGSIAHAKKFCDDPRYDFSFNPDCAEDQNKTLRVKIAGTSPSASEICTASLHREGKFVYVFIRVMFKVSVKNGRTADDFDFWAESHGGHYCVQIEPSSTGWEPNEDFAGEVYLGTKNEYGHSFSDLYPS